MLETALVCVKGKVMNKKELFCFCGLCIYGNKEIFKGNRELVNALKLYFITPHAPTTYHS
jgi:hypothetical protein